MRRRGFRIPKIRLRRPRFRRPAFRRPSRESFRRLVPRRGGGWGNLTLPVVGLVGILCLFFSGSVLLKGCGSESKKLADPSANGEPSKASDEVVAQDERIPGKWKGRAGLNQSKIALKLQTLQPRHAAFVKQVADQHLNTELTANFQADGTMTMKVQSSPPYGQVTVNRISGSWKTITRSEDQVTLDLEFVREADGKKIHNRLNLQFVEGTNLVAMVAPTGPEISDCEPFYLFQKSSESVNVATNQDQVFKK